MYLNIVVIVTCFVASVMQSLLMNVFLYTAVLKRVVLIFLLKLDTNLHYYYYYYTMSTFRKSAFSQGGRLTANCTPCPAPQKMKST